MQNRNILIAYIWVAAFSISAALAQTQKEIDFVAERMKKPQTPSSTLAYLAGNAQGRGDWTEALSRYDAILKIYAADPGLGNECPKYAWALARRAQCLKALGRDKEANAESHRALDIVFYYPPKLYRAERSYVLNTIEFTTSVIGTDEVSKHFAGKLPFRRRTKLMPVARSEIADVPGRISETKAILATMSKSHPEYYANVLDLANLSGIQKEYSLAEPRFKEVIDWAKTNFAGKDDRYLLVPLSRYGYMLMEAGRVEEGKKVEAELNKIDAGAIPGFGLK